MAHSTSDRTHRAKPRIFSRIRAGLAAVLLVAAFALLIAGSAWMVIEGQDLNRIVGIAGLLFFGVGGILILVSGVRDVAGVSGRAWQVTERATGRVLLTSSEWTPYKAVESLIDAGWTWEQLEVADEKMGQGDEFHGHIPSYGSLNIARTDASAMLVAETVAHSDTMFTCPAALVRCAEPQLDALAAELEIRCWGPNYDDMGPMIWFVPFETASAVLELGPDKVLRDGIWINPSVAAHAPGLPDAVRQVLSGQREGLVSDSDKTSP